MLSTIDLVIAFAVIMTVLSLLITILVQMVSSAMALRGKNLANALGLTFQNIDPTSASRRILWRRRFCAIKFFATRSGDARAGPRRRAQMRPRTRSSWPSER